VIGHALELLRFAGALAVLTLPGVLALGLLAPAASVLLRWVIGATAGLAAAVFLAFVLAYVKLALFYPAWAIVAGSLLVASWLHRKPRPAFFARPAGAVLILAIVLAIVAATRFGVTLGDELPPGWDSSFHLILAKKLALSGRMIFDWEPFENIALNYPLGSHVLVTIVAAIARIPLHAAFKLLIPACGVLSTALVYLFASRVGGRDEVGAFAALAYGMWAVYGSIDTYRWGGLPNALAMAFLLAVFVAIASSPPDMPPRGLSSIFLAALALTHHHVMLVAGFVLVCLGGFYLATGRRDRALRGVLLPVAGAAVLGSFYLVPYALKAGTLSATGVLAFNEPLFTPALVATSLGIVFCAAAALGVVVSWRARGGELGTLHTAAASLLFLFVVFEYVYRLISWASTGSAHVAFTPSRFLTDLAYLLAVYAGLAIVWAKDRLGLRPGTALVTCLVLALTTIPAWKAREGEGDPAPLFRAFQWIERNTPPDALVLNEHPWAVYGSWRRCAATPIPVSEPSREGTPKSMLFRAIASGSLPDEARGSMIVQAGAFKGKELPWPVLWSDPGGVSVVERWHGTGGGAGGPR
jgi:hypothetical protein